MTYYGKYRGTVADNVDPLQQGRVRVKVPTVLAEGEGSWALPCTPYAGPGVGLFLIPPIGANVWVEFEGGNTDAPIWSGCFWNAGDAPVTPAVAETKVLKTDAATVTIADTAGTVTIELATGAKVELTGQGVTITSGAGGKIAVGGAQVSVNDGALEVA